MAKQSFAYAQQHHSASGALLFVARYERPILIWSIRPLTVITGGGILSQHLRGV